MANEEEANLLIRLKDEASKGLATIRGSVLALGVSVAGLTAFLTSAVKSFLESDRAVNSLNAALKTQGIFTEQLSKEMQAYAKELQRQSTFSDEAIISAQTLLTTFGLAGKQNKEATKTALDLSTALGIDLNTAALLLGKAFQGQTETLGRYGIKIADNIPVTERYAAVLEAVNEKVGGRAQAELDSFAGKTQNLKERFDDVKESIGQALIPVFEFLIKRAEMLFDAFEIGGGVINSFKIVFLSAMQEVIAGVQIAVESIPGLGTALGIVGVNFETVNQKIQEQIDKIIELGGTETAQAEQSIINSNIVTQTHLSNLARRETEERERLAKINANAKKANEERVKLDLDHIARRRKADEDLKNAQKMFDEERMRNFQTSLQFISSLATSENKKLAAIGKAAAIATATIDTFIGIGKAWALGPILGPPMAALVATAGFANVAKIAGVKLATGGVVLPRAGGIQATLAEAGQAEAVIPLGSDRAREQMQEAGIGQTVNLTVNVGTLVGSDGMREFTKMVDQELFSLRRNNESVAFEAV